ncbi:MAG TPA: tRNA (guanosine(46)-N7)-methyltransferase TrmB [Rickettsiales bacterium]|nr:tRNA (guanosine(46)-N7)-methyltransferase TrmB [Rickettsiales bacterium]
MESSHSLLPSFGRRRGRKLRASRSILFETLLPKLLIPEPASSLTPAELFAEPEKPLWFEIGFGGGEHMAQQARWNPNVNFIGCEPYINGMASLLASVDKEKIANIRLFDGDARLLLEKLPDASIERMFVLFPDPWPKARHHKKRIISQGSLELFYRKLKPGGRLRIATDHVDYGIWMLENLLAFKKFTWEANNHTDWDTPPADWVRTRYQAKAEAEGRMATFLNLVK